VSVGDIPADGEDALNAVDLNHRGRHLPPEEISVLLPELRLQVAAASRLAYHVFQVLPVAGICPDIQFDRGMPDHLLAGVSNEAQKRLVAIDIAAVVKTIDIDGVEAGLECSAIAFFTGLQRPLRRSQAFLRGFGGGDIAHHAQHALNTLNLHRGCRQQYPDSLSALLDELRLRVPETLTVGQRCHHIPPHFRLRPEVEVQRSAPDDFLALKPHKLEECLVGIDEPSIVQLAHEDAVNAGLENGAVMRFACAQCIHGRDQPVVGLLGRGNIARYRKDAANAIRFDQRPGCLAPDDLPVFPSESGFHIPAP
jgi:hypothetical protein